MFFSFCFGWMELFYKWTGIEFVVRGAEHLDTDKPLIVVANHQSALDVYTMTKIYPHNCSVILKSSLRFAPVFNWMMYLADSIFIDRFTKEKSKHSLTQALEKIEKFNVCFSFCIYLIIFLAQDLHFSRRNKECEERTSSI